MFGLMPLSTVHLHLLDLNLNLLESGAGYMCNNNDVIIAKAMESISFDTFTFHARVSKPISTICSCVVEQLWRSVVHMRHFRLRLPV